MTHLHVVPVFLHGDVQVVSNQVIHISVLQVCKGHIGNVVVCKVPSEVVPNPSVVVHPPFVWQLSNKAFIIPRQHLEVEVGTLDSGGCVTSQARWMWLNPHTYTSAVPMLCM